MEGGEGEGKGVGDERTSSGALGKASLKLAKINTILSAGGMALRGQ